MVNDSKCTSGLVEAPEPTEGPYPVPWTSVKETDNTLVVVFRNGQVIKYDKVSEVKGHLAGLVEVFGLQGQVIAGIAGPTIQTFYWEKPTS